MGLSYDWDLMKPLISTSETYSVCQKYRMRWRRKRGERGEGRDKEEEEEEKEKMLEIFTFLIRIVHPGCFYLVLGLTDIKRLVTISFYFHLFCESKYKNF